jgi:hypothetical protein
MVIMAKRGMDMLKKSIWPSEHRKGFLAAGIGAFLLATGGCAGDAPKPAPTMTQDQVRSNADKAFEKLKQEEKNRAVGSGPAPY